MNEERRSNYATLPTGDSRAPAPIGHFPDVMHAAIWRNWDLVPMSRIAEVLDATHDQIEEIATSMGLAKQEVIALDTIERCYVTLIRRNWHLMPYEQLCKLLGWDASRMEHTLLDDDFLWVKMGMQKPICEPIIYRPPTAKARGYAQRIKKIVGEAFDPAFLAGVEAPFAFIKRYATTASANPTANANPPDGFELRMVYPYFLRYGDSLIGSAIEDVPEGSLAELQNAGVNAIWLQGILRHLAPWDLEPELSSGWEERLQNLNRLVARAGRFGIGVYLYLNEPRSMPMSFFERHPDLRGVSEISDRAWPSHPAQSENFTLCTSVREVQEFLVNSVRHIFQNVPQLAGAFTITHSENLTNCYSRKYKDHDACPRCRARGPETVIAEVNDLIARGMHSGQPAAKLIVWDWAWPEEWVEGIIQRIPQDAWLMRVSEWGTPFQRGDYHGRAGEYSISIVGPSDESRHHWELARRRGLKTVAKVQIGNSWELSVVPYIPAMALIARHISNLCRADVDGLMLGWTLGGLPSVNFRIVSEFLNGSRGLSPQAAMLAVAEKCFGGAAAPRIVQAWELFSNGFAEFPFDMSVVYFAPLQTGPANLFYLEPTGYSATMAGIPYDDLAGWCGPYSSDMLCKQFIKVAAGFKEGVALLVEAHAENPTSALADHLRIAEAAAIHFQSIVNQIRFVQDRGSDRKAASQILRSEIDLARRMCDLVAQDSRIGFEATSHYFYTRNDLIEKIVNCRFLLDKFGNS